ncbi:deoxynucleoside monophosphate kinase [Streptomyces phage Faust]|uniref:Deoxynucleoside monophosphate kinase n=1 Tax=Streptomyces phage Faust TaxID=2767565 RepID=A0A7G9UYT0_9CAUD|nr:deoxynucleoside monophosphate kinase [Streptomyces phage Faust]QNN99185.1 deoxynucleoside monophosphate kinase [Streptomyces phage Faust]
MIIGLAGYARSGKDSAADALEGIGFCRIAFADKLREFAYEINPIVEGYIGTQYSLQEVIDEHGWDGYKDTYFAESVREQLQYIGTDVVRRILGPDTWANATFSAMDDTKNYVITDVRFPNEADGIRQRRGRVYRIVREGIGPANDHFSERALDHYEYDGFIHNDGTLDEFHNSVRRRILEGRH